MKRVHLESHCLSSDANYLAVEWRSISYTKKTPLNFQYFVLPKCQFELPSVRTGHLCFKVVNSTCGLINLLLSNLILTFYLIMQLERKKANVVRWIYRYIAAYWEKPSELLTCTPACLHCEFKVFKDSFVFRVGMSQIQLLASVIC